MLMTKLIKAALVTVNEILVKYFKFANVLSVSLRS